MSRDSQNRGGKTFYYGHNPPCYVCKGRGYFGPPKIHYPPYTPEQEAQIQAEIAEKFLALRRKP